MPHDGPRTHRTALALPTVSAGARAGGASRTRTSLSEGGTLPGATPRVNSDGSCAAPRRESRPSSGRAVSGHAGTGYTAVQPYTPEATRGPRHGRTTPFILGATAAGLVYLFDPDNGRGRRARIADQMTSKLRGATHEVNAKLDDVHNRAFGAVAEALPDEKPESDAALVQKVKSEVIGREPWGSQTIDVEAVDGVVTLRGQLDTSQQIEDLCDAVSGVTGVKDVTDLLHLPGQPAKDAAADTGRGASPHP